MKKMFSMTALTMALTLSATCWAGPLADATKAALMEARDNLVGLLAENVQTAQNKRIDAIKQATTKVDAHISKNGETLKEFAEVWIPFKTTRDEEIVPYILAGKKDEAKALATTIQAERFKKMLTILGALNQ
ncbi:hypothetical protein [Candidatus Magnetaquicoccus inordinatus]|uniref:hypothetical protein n=1 Tax=Candidatus Magnetaquicoccus inordinatus TaxID=2496818 RepID=UPI00102BFDD5|nr:hypothetical protein [Candidatus Magnetaquicoccus inordinatus]